MDWHDFDTAVSTNAETNSIHLSHNIFVMKTILAFLIFATFTLSTKAQSNLVKEKEAQIEQYWFVLLKKGNNRTQDSATAAKIQEQHLASIDRLYYEGKIKVAWPFGDNGDWRGIFIFDCKTKEEVEQLLQSDPAISSGRLAYEIKPWYTAPIGSFTHGKPPKALETK